MGLSLGAIVGLVGCGEQTDDVETEEGAAAQSENGLTMNGLAMNGLTMNGLAMNGLAMNGLAMNGLTMNGLSGLSTTSGLMTTSGGRNIVKYMVKCAFPSGTNLVKSYGGTTYTFAGALGVAPELNSSSTSACGVDCQERVSACMLAHVNNAGVHISLWLDSEGAIGWGQSTSYPYQEGSFFGNLFPTSWKGYYCTGKDYYTASVPGRLGAPLTSSVYVNPFGTECQASGRCATHGTDGYDSCQTYDGYTYKHIVTAWRNFDTNSTYKICNYGTGETKCMGVVGGSTSDGARIEARTYNSSNAMKWQLTQVAVGKYKLINVGSGKALDSDSSGNAVQKTYSSSSATQQNLVKTLSPYQQYGRYLVYPGSAPYEESFWVPSNSDGALVSITTNTPTDTAKWTIVPN